MAATSTWVISTTVEPLTWDAWSKNSMWLAAGRKRYMNPAHAASKAALALKVRSALTNAGYKPRKDKLRVHIHVARPCMRGDPANVLDLVLDAVQEGTGIDDRYYEIGGLTWELDRENPHMVVTVSQDG